MTPLVGAEGRTVLLELGEHSRRTLATKDEVKRVADKVEHLERQVGDVKGTVQELHTALIGTPTNPGFISRTDGKVSDHEDRIRSIEGQKLPKWAWGAITALGGALGGAVAKHFLG